MTLAAILAALQAAETLLPNLLSLANQIKAGLSTTDAAALEAQIKSLQATNDAAFSNVDAELDAASKT